LRLCHDAELCHQEELLALSLLCLLPGATPRLAILSFEILAGGGYRSVCAPVCPELAAGCGEIWQGGARRLPAGEANAGSGRDEGVLAWACLETNQIHRTRTALVSAWDMLTVEEHVRILRLVVERVDYNGVKGQATLTYQAAGLVALVTEWSAKPKEQDP
jgi:hypothetical protein